MSLLPRPVRFQGVIRIKRIEYAPGDPGTATEPGGGGKEQFVEHQSAQEVHSDAGWAMTCMADRVHRLVTIITRNGFGCALKVPMGFTNKI